MLPLTPFPFDRKVFTYSYTYWDDIFSKDDINFIIQLCESIDLERGLVNKGYESKARSSLVNFHRPNEENNWLFEKLFKTTDILNNRFYGYNLTGFESFQYTVYNQTDYFDWHLDMNFGKEETLLETSLPRKMSFSLLLSDPNDFEGGELIIDTGEPITTEKVFGRVYCFPSFVRHRISPITSGVRKSLVWWALGPKFK